MGLLLRVTIGLLAVGSPGLASAAWHEAQSKHFVIYADQNPGDLKRFATKLERFDKAVRIVRGMDDPPLGNAGRLTVFVLTNAEAVSKLVSDKRTWLSGIYFGSAEGSFAFVPKEDDGGNDNTTFFHEYAHHIMLQNADVAYPAWFVEGFAEFFSTAEFKGDTVVQLGKPAEHRAYGLMNLGKPKIESLLGASFSGGDADEAERLYGRSWLLTHYLAFEEKRKAQLANYIQAMQSGKDTLEAARAAFGDLQQLDRELDSYLRRRSLVHLNIKDPSFATVQVQVRPLREGEAKIIPIRMKSARGANEESAKTLAAEARTAAAPYPAEAIVQTALAEAEYDAGDYAAAEAAADRALKADPTFAQAMLFKGKAQMRLAEEKQDPVDWPAIRSWFTKANRLDPEDAEPLMLFYDSFLSAGERPTANAKSGLDYALLLSPQDPGLRWKVVNQLMRDSKYAEARRTLATLAFSPHQGEGSDYVRKIMTALAEPDPETALLRLASGPSAERAE